MATLDAKFKRRNGSIDDVIHFETSWAKVVNKPTTFTPTSHNHSATEITSGTLGTARLGTGTASASTFLRGDNTWAAPTISWGSITSKPSVFTPETHSHAWSTITSKPSFAAVATSGSYNDLSNKPTIPTIPSVMGTTEGETGTATTQRTINAANLKSIILNHSPAGSRPASDVYSWAKAASKPSYSWNEIGSKPAVIIEGDARLTNSRPASDVKAWAKATNKPTYTQDEITDGTTYKRVTQAEKSSWNEKVNIVDVETKIGAYDDYVMPFIHAKIATSLKGAVNGVAELGADGKVPSSQLPSFVDDVLEYAAFANLPTTGETGKIYITKDTNKTYRWSGSAYVEISASLALGQTSSTAGRGDWTKAAYDHSQATGNPHGTTLSNLGVTATAAEVNVLDGITATTTELNYTDGVTSNIQTQLNGKAASSHTHTFASLTSKPTTKAGYGITDVYTITQIQSMLTNKSDLEHGHDADQIQSGILSTLRIPNLDTSKLTSGTLGVARGGTGRSTLTSGSVLVGNGTSAVSLVSRNGIDSRSTFPPSTHGHGTTLTYLGERTTLGESTIAAIANYSMFYITFNVEWADGFRTDSGVIFGNNAPTSTMVFDTYNGAPVMINAYITGNRFIVNGDGVMPYAMLTGASLLQVKLYGMTIQ